GESVSSVRTGPRTVTSAGLRAAIAEVTAPLSTLGSPQAAADSVSSPATTAAQRALTAAQGRSRQRHNEPGHGWHAPRGPGGRDVTELKTGPAAAAAPPSDHRDRLYIGGRWVPSTGSGRIDVTSASTEEVIGSIPEGTPEDVERAVQAAAAALPGWSALSPGERAQYLLRIQQGLAARSERIANLISGEVGMPLPLSTMIQAGLPTIVSGIYAQLITDYSFEEEIGNSLVVREPVGVVAAITPWNYPLHQIVAKVAPALAAGCTVVLKPSEVAPLNAFVFAEVMEEAELPAGVFN